LVQVVQKLDLAHDARDVLLGDVVEGNLLNGHNVARVHVEGLVDGAVVALAQHLT